MICKVLLKKPTYIYCKCYDLQSFIKETYIYLNVMICKALLKKSTYIYCKCYDLQSFTKETYIYLL